MNNNGQYVKKDDNDSKRIFAMLIMVLTLMVCTTGATYAYFAIAPVSNSSATGTAATANLTLAVTRLTPGNTKWSSSTQKLVPQLDSSLATAMNATNECVDANGNVVCQVYQVVLTNGSTSKVRVNGTLTFTLTPNNTGHNFKYRLKDNGTATALTIATAATNLGAVTTTAITSGTAISLANQKILAVGTSYRYYFVVWVQETGTTDQTSVDAGVTFNATVDFNAVDASGATIGGITSTIT